jgi:hypothetical protein
LERQDSEVEHSVLNVHQKRACLYTQ